MFLIIVEESGSLVFFELEGRLEVLDLRGVVALVRW